MCVFAASSWNAFQDHFSLAEWDDLARVAAEPNPFCESWNLAPALERFARERNVALVSLQVSGELCGLMPLARAARYFGYPLPNMGNWSHDNMFVGSPLVRSGYEEAFWRELFSWADAHAGGAMFLHLGWIAEDGPLLRALSQVADRQNRAWGVVQREERALLHSGLGPQEYLEAAMSGKKRKELRRQHKRLAEEGELRFERRGDQADVDRWIEEFLALEQAGWKGRNRTALADDSRTCNWFAQTLHGASAHGRLERLTLTLDGKPIAMLANFITPPGAFSFKTAFDERFARFSPGVLLQLENLDLLEREDVAWCDSCAAADHPMIERIWREKRAMVRVNVAIGGPLRRALFRPILRAESRGKARGA
ncbi:GNAT family N-acetyltransferase [Pelagerythrobacter rhizovicinus]|uniref:GNAT family N-acetyltransferase n=1 Tax=Pelagerythrobacter rhizovicinus TaxID=2268576 RepID=A0A4Q2KTK0_9SPHN|nr:GNAT family N-acetyltransferase [Pelagerythrobacter rhizovicinus]